jgi:predicted neuraminidase
MIEFLLASTLSVSQAHSIHKQEDVNQVCAYLVGIPYASDNFSDNEWARFKYCRELLSETTK